MKKLNIYAGAILLALMGGGLSACNDDLAQPPVEIPVVSTDGNPVIGDGTWEKPLQVWQAHLGTTIDGHLSNWVTGYIVGCIDSDVTNSFKSAVICSEDIRAPKNNNVLLAQYPYNEEEWAKIGYTIDDCIAVQLPSGASRTAVNLVDNPENFNRLISLRGETGSKYMGEYGLRSAYEYNWGDKGRYEEPYKDIEGEYYCDFSVSHDVNYYRERGWSTVTQSGGLTGWYVSEYQGRYFMTCSSYYGSSNGGPYLNWAITPQLDLRKVKNKTLSFSSQVRTVAAGTTLEVYILTHKNPLSCEPIKLDCVVSTSDNTWVSSGDIDLSEYADLGEIYIGFLYKAESGGDGASTYNFTDFNFGGADPLEWEVLDPALKGTFRFADKVDAGKRYALVFDEQYAAVHFAESSNYGSMSVKRVLVDEGLFEMTIENAILFSKPEPTDGEDGPVLADDEFVLSDCYGRILYMQGTYTTFQIAPAGVMPTSQYIWKVKIENGKTTITNKDRNLEIRFNAAQNTVAPNGNGENPVLYELVESSVAN